MAVSLFPKVGTKHGWNVEFVAGDVAATAWLGKIYNLITSSSRSAYHMDSYLWPWPAFGSKISHGWQSNCESRVFEFVFPHVKFGMAVCDSLAHIAWWFFTTSQHRQVLRSTHVDSENRPTGKNCGGDQQRFGDVVKLFPSTISGKHSLITSN